MPPEKIAELRLKHLDLIQAVVGRMSGYGPTFKNHSITLTTAICGLAVTLQRPLVALVAGLPITIFALLDAQYLRLERRFRVLFDRVRTEDWGVVPSFEVDLKNSPQLAYWPIVFSWSIGSFYGPLGLGVLVVIAVSGAIYGRII